MLSVGLQRYQPCLPYKALLNWLHPPHLPQRQRSPRAQGPHKEIEEPKGGQPQLHCHKAIS